jgi:hypothetical protein
MIVKEFPFKVEILLSSLVGSLLSAIMSVVLLHATLTKFKSTPFLTKCVILRVFLINLNANCFLIRALFINTLAEYASLEIILKTIGFLQIPAVFSLHSLNHIFILVHFSVMYSRHKNIQNEASCRILTSLCVGILLFGLVVSGFHVSNIQDIAITRVWDQTAKLKYQELSVTINRVYLVTHFLPFFIIGTLTVLLAWYVESRNLIRGLQPFRFLSYLTISYIFFRLPYLISAQFFMDSFDAFHFSLILDRFQGVVDCMIIFQFL